MTRKILPLAVLLALGLAPAVRAVGYCSVSYCQGQPATKLCGCPPESDKPGAPATCGSYTWSKACWYFQASAEDLRCSAESSTDNGAAAAVENVPQPF